MKLARFSTAVVCTALLAVATHAEAKSKPKSTRPCQLLIDPAGDANGIDPGAPVPAVNAGPSDDALDILDINVGEGQKLMVWRLHVKKLAPASLDAPTGMFWSIHFTIRKTTFKVTAHSSLTGFTSDVSYTSAGGSGKLAGLGATIDLQRSEIRFVLPAASIVTQEPAPWRATITAIGGQTGQEMHTVAINAVDWTASDAKYVPGKPVRCATSG